MLAVLLSARILAAAAIFTALPGHLRPTPFGGIVATDGAPTTLHLVSARRAFVSCHLLVQLPQPGTYQLSITTPENISVDLYREWFHYLPEKQQYLPDALIPVSLPYAARHPDVENRVPKQTSQAFWADIWIPETAVPGKYTVVATLTSGKTHRKLSIPLQVLSTVTPNDDAVTIDHNTYGTSWFAQQYPNSKPDTFALIHAYHRLFYEHRGTFHQLGYGHAGKTSPDFAPQLAGTGRNKHIADWSAFDRHYGPLLDGSAFAQTKRGANPIPFVYLPINPEWPAAYEFWGEPGYEREFVNVVSEMERHFREKGWTHTNFELFFNHKKRYKGFEWDGDEARFAGDYAYLREYRRLLDLAVPKDSPVHFVFRADASWTMERQWKDLAGIVNFWVCGGGMFSWYRGAAETLQQRGDIVWTYGGTPAVTEPSTQINLDLLRTWLQGATGFVRWLTTAPGDDPWFHFAGGSEALVYPGDRFGVAGPIPSIRLKLERNALQDIALLNQFVPRAAAAQAFNGSTLADWWQPRPALADTDPKDWSNADIDDVSPPAKPIDPAAWQRLHDHLYAHIQ